MQLNRRIAGKTGRSFLLAVGLALGSQA